ncbi:anti-sigma regulatory factor (Ser/Thr protein kinase) [Kitasatospora sp. GP82]|nr:anti-sigma regulatory factor (Ser/Thr protein kinase) [Kitasatospora sp. GP82]
MNMSQNLPYPDRSRPVPTSLLSAAVSPARPDTPIVAPEQPGTGNHDGERRRTVTFIPQPEHVRQTRHMVTAVLRHWRLDHLRHSAELAVSELVTNAIQHASNQNPITVTVEHDEQWLSIAVSDHSVGLPRTRRAARHHENGRGLLLVGLLADSWHCEAHSDGTKTVSCRLPISNPDRAEPCVPPRRQSQPLRAGSRHCRPPRAGPPCAA